MFGARSAASCEWSPQRDAQICKRVGTLLLVSDNCVGGIAPLTVRPTRMVIATRSDDATGQLTVGFESEPSGTEVAAVTPKGTVTAMEAGVDPAAPEVKEEPTLGSYVLLKGPSLSTALWTSQRWCLSPLVLHYRTSPRFGSGLAFYALSASEICQGWWREW